MPRKREGYTQVPLEMPDPLLEQVRAAAERDEMKLATWIMTACAAKAGVEFVPAKLGRPAAAPPVADDDKPKRGRPKAK
jgi:hypothetical protein